VLIGHYFQSLSKKGRVALPVNFRKHLGSRIILSRWYEGSLAIFQTEWWKKIVEQATQGLSVTAPARDTERFLLGGAYEIELDSQGRFVIPQPAREYAKFVSSEVVFVGLGNRVEIWEKRRWIKREKEIVEHAEELLEKARSRV
jgi:MraZ protein